MRTPGYRVVEHFYADIRIRIAAKDHEDANAQVADALSVLETYAPNLDATLLKDEVFPEQRTPGDDRA